MTSVTVRYWASARAAAGLAQETFEADTLAELMDAAERAHADRPRFALILRVAALVVDEQPVGARAPDSVMLSEGAVVEVLPPFAGGAGPSRRRGQSRVDQDVTITTPAHGNIG